MNRLDDSLIASRTLVFIVLLWTIFDALMRLIESRRRRKTRAKVKAAPQPYLRPRQLLREPIFWLILAVGLTGVLSLPLNHQVVDTLTFATIIGCAALILVAPPYAISRILDTFKHQSDDKTHSAVFMDQDAL